MSVLIKGQDMPRDCYECIAITYVTFDNRTEYYCLAKSRDLLKVDDYLQSGKRPPECPLVEVPTPHGRLIDADKLFTWFEGDSLAKYPIGDAKQYNTIMYYEVFGEIDDAPTVIGAEGGEND